MWNRRLLSAIRPPVPKAGSANVTRTEFALALCSLLPLCAQDPAAALEHARAVNLERAASMPNFVVDETAIRYHSPHTDPPKWKQFDKIEMELIVQGGGVGPTAEYSPRRQALEEIRFLTLQLGRAVRL